MQPEIEAHDRLSEALGLRSVYPHAGMSKCNARMERLNVHDLKHLAHQS